MSLHGMKDEKARAQPAWRCQRQSVAAIAITGIAVGCGIELSRLIGEHTTGGEIAGVIVAAPGLGAAILSLALIASCHPRATPLLYWIALAHGGTVGNARHTTPSTPSHAAFSDRWPRPLLALLIFTVFGMAGAARLLITLAPLGNQASSEGGMS